MDYARVLRGEVLKLATTDFAHLAIVAGCNRWQIMMKHIFPNLVNTLLILATLGIGSTVISEATLSFLGLGIPRPQPSWGIMLAESQKYLYTAWRLPLIPGVAFSLLVMASNLVGDRLRDRFDPTPSSSGIERSAIRSVGGILGYQRRLSKSPLAASRTFAVSVLRKTKGASASQISVANTCCPLALPTLLPHGRHPRSTPGL